MKKGSIGLFAIASAAFVATSLAVGLTHHPSAIAKDDPCYMVTSSGRRVSLGKLCRGSSQPASQGIFQARIKRRSGGTPVIDVMFNGNQTFEMLVDTGASGTLITRSMARTLRIPIIGANQFVMADGRPVVLPIGRLNSISVQGAVVQNVNVAIASDSADGLLGHDFLGNYDIKIKRDVVEFYPR